MAIVLKQLPYSGRYRSRSPDDPAFVHQSATTVTCNNCTKCHEPFIVRHLKCPTSLPIRSGRTFSIIQLLAVLFEESLISGRFGFAVKVMKNVGRPKDRIVAIEVPETAVACNGSCTGISFSGSDRHTQQLHQMPRDLYDTSGNPHSSLPLPRHQIIRVFSLKVAELRREINASLTTSRLLALTRFVGDHTCKLDRN
ncbi:hypothetical protein E4U60_001567 [Claviceps pazoutovae]|uniref:Uncharacterized protein n=1 Tax=Claviceps pazoutovae TaxID=1649127 RepID=A0A9P7MD03_9HYPO|nr:hypothetical protein E4U60_001567 [Claviceps pazoutovae]